jgi:hypothetical protein
MFDGWWPLLPFLYWLTCASLQYAHLAVMQVYVAAEREIGGLGEDTDMDERVARRTPPEREGMHGNR